MQKKPKRQGSAGSPTPHETQTPPLPTDSSSPKESERPLAREEKSELHRQARQQYEKDWLAPKGSEQEKQFLRQWARQEKSPELRDRICKWIDNPDEITKWMNNPDKFGKHNELFWEIGKESVLGPVVYSIARERHGKLDDQQWLVACFTAQGMKQKEIAKLMHVSDKTVDNVIRDLKKIVAQDLTCSFEVDNCVQIARWFLGLY